MIHRDIKDENILVVNVNTNFPFIRATGATHSQPVGRGVGGGQKVLHHQKVSSSNSYNNSSQANYTTADDVSQIVHSSLPHQKLSTAPSAMTTNLQHLMGSPASTVPSSGGQQFAPGILALT